MKAGRHAFTLIEVLISIALLSLVLLALYKSLGMLRSSNTQLFSYLERAAEEKKGTETLFLDIMGSDGNITIKGDEFSRLCIENTVNSLYELPSAKVCWVVAKKDHALLRSEGNRYRLPLGSDARVAVDEVMKDIDLFRIYRSRDRVLVLLQQKNRDPISFMVQGVPKKEKKKKKKAPAKKKKKKKGKKGNKDKKENNTSRKPSAPPSLPSKSKPDLNLF